MKSIIKTISHALLGGIILLSSTSCHEFVFGNVSVSEEENPILNKKTPRTGAEVYFGEEEFQHKLPIDKNANVPNPDPDGAFANWYTCLVMVKEGHSHYNGKLHGNPVYEKKAWKQEQFALIRNTENGPVLEMDTESIKNVLEAQGPNYFRIVGGSSRLWAVCLYFYDKEGKLINNKILKQSDQYQIFFSISDLDDKNQPYKVMDVRYRKGMPEKTPITGVEAEYFKGKDSFEARREATPDILHYTYRDTWTHEDMADGARDYFNLKLLPPLGTKDIFDITTHDQDYVGLKGHILFDFPFDTDENHISTGIPREYGVDGMEWPLQLSKENGYGTKEYRRETYLLPKFYLSMRVMKCEKGKKYVVEPNSIATADDQNRTVSKQVCAPFYKPDSRSDWKELIRVNIPFKVFASSYDSDPTGDDPYEPYYYHIGSEIGLSPEDTYEYINSGGVEQGLGFDVWFL